MPESGPGRLASWALPLLCVVLAAGLLYVSFENLRLKKDLAQAVSMRRVEQAVMTDRAGETAPPIPALLPDGQEFVIRTDALSAPIVLAWLKEDCDACVTTMDAWNRLADRHPGQVWGIARGSPPAPETASPWRDARFTIVTPVSNEVFAGYNIDVTPQTMLVLQNGTIGEVRYGPLSEKDVDDLAQRLRQPVERGGDGK